MKNLLRDLLTALVKEPIPEFFEDGLSADLAEADITRVADAYKEGYEARDQELKERLRKFLGEKPSQASVEKPCCQPCSTGRCSPSAPCVCEDVSKKPTPKGESK